MINISIETAFLYSMLGELYMNHCKLNPSKYAPYSSEKPSQSDNLQQWNFARLKSEIRQSLLRSLKDEQALQKIPLKDYQAVLLGDTTYRRLRSTLYEFFAQRAINIFKSGQFHNWKDYQNINHLKYYLLPEAFAAYTFKSHNSTSFTNSLLKSVKFSLY